jgi:hypothetical protein
MDCVPSWSCCCCSKAVYKPVWHTPLLNVELITPDDGHRNCPKNVEFHFQNKIWEISASSWFYYKEQRTSWVKNLSLASCGWVCMPRARSSKLLPSSITWGRLKWSLSRRAEKLERCSSNSLHVTWKLGWPSFTSCVLIVRTDRLGLQQNVSWKRDKTDRNILQKNKIISSISVQCHAIASALYQSNRIVSVANFMKQGFWGSRRSALQDCLPPPLPNFNLHPRVPCYC